MLMLKPADIKPDDNKHTTETNTCQVITEIKNSKSWLEINHRRNNAFHRRIR